MDTSSNSGASAKIVTALIIGLIVGFGAGAFWQERRLSNESPGEGVAVGEEEKAGAGKDMEQSASTAASMEKTETKAAAASGTAAILVAEQPAGASVRVAQVVTPESVWVAVREEKDGKLGNILGARRVAAGTNTAVIVELLRPTRSGGRYIAVLHQDAGDAAFNYREDVLVEGVEGRFTAK